MLIISENDRSNYLIYNNFFKLITFKTKEEKNCSAVHGMKSSAHFSFICALYAREHLHLLLSEVNSIF